jgi:hypothetical protein
MMPPAATPSRSDVRGSPIDDPYAWTSALFAAIDAKDTGAFVRFLADDGRFAFANFPPAIGIDAIRHAVDAFFGSVAQLRHDVANAWSVPGHVVCTGHVTYVRRDGTAVTLPFCNVLRLAGDRVDDYRIYIDPSPLFAAEAPR